MSAAPGRPLRRNNPTRRDTTWMADAACAGLPSDEFFPGQGQRITEAVQHVCGSCPVRLECLEHGIATRADGVWGGVGEHDRRRIARELRNAGWAPSVSAPSAEDASRKP